MKILNMLLFAGILTMCSPCFGSSCSATLPSAARVVLGAQPQWKLVAVEDLSPDDKGLWAHKHGEKCPGIAVGRFNGAPGDSYAVALIHKIPNGSPTEQLVVLLRSGSGYRRTILVGPASISSPQVVWTVPPGKYTGFGRAQTISTRNDSFVYERIEATSTLFFYVNGKFRSLLTSD